VRGYPGTLLGELNPIELIAPLAERRVPILHLHGDKDWTVLMEPNSVEFVRRYQASGGPIELEVLWGEGHSPGPKFFASEKAIAFLLASQEKSEP
jgi:hypothetical protein